MAKDATKEEEEKKLAAEKKEKEEEEKKKKKDRKPTPLEVLYKNLQRVYKAVLTKERGLFSRSLRTTNFIRRHLPISDVRAVVERYVPSDSDRSEILHLLDVAAAGAPEDVDMDTPAPAATGSEEEKKEEVEAAPKPPSIGNVAAVEVSTYLNYLALSFLVAQSQWAEVATAARSLAERIRDANSRSLDMFNSKAWVLLSLAHERLGTLSSIRDDLLGAHRTVCLRHDELGRATLVNLILRNFLHYRLYDQANKFFDMAKGSFPQSASNNQTVRFLHYQGRIQAVRLDYTDAYSNLIQAVRKAPATTALGFRVASQKLAVIVQLLMGDVPDRNIFVAGDMAGPLAPYFSLTKAVRIGDLAAFNRVLAENESTFQHDDTLSLIARLRQNVIKTGLRKIATSYSRISFVDVAEKLHLDSPEDAEFLCAKAIRDCVIDATLNHEEGSLSSNPVPDLYSTSEPQQSFHTRIKFCLDVHNEAVKGMKYPPDAHKKEMMLSAAERLEREKDEAELAEELEEMDDDEEDEV